MDTAARPSDSATRTAAADFEQTARYLDRRAVRTDPGQLTLGVAIDGSSARVRELLDEVDPARATVTTFAVHAPTLDDVFLALTEETTHA